MEAEHCVILGHYMMCQHCAQSNVIPTLTTASKAVLLIQAFVLIHADCQPPVSRPNKKGILCPRCQSTQHERIETRQQNGYTRRRLQCLECHFRFTSHETLAPNASPPPSHDDAP
jgi:hypothetical protein